jgi:hypothetical protein
VHQQRVQLVQRHPGGPAGRQRDGVLVTAHDVLVVRRAEQGQHGQVGLPVTAVRGRVDEPAAAPGPQHVAGPAVAVDPAGRLGRPGQRVNPRHDLLDQGDVAGAQRAVVGGPAQVGQEAALGVPARPPVGRGPGGVVQRQAGDEPGPRGAERLRPRRVQAGQITAERGGRGGSDRTRRQPAQDQDLVVPAQDLGDRDGAGRGQPVQAAGLGLDGAAGAGACGAGGVGAGGIGAAGGGEFGEDFAAVGEGGTVVRGAVLGPGPAQIPHWGAGERADPGGDRVGWHARFRPGRGRPAGPRAGRRGPWPPPG